jgi:excisionase family DNA binding protein
VRDAPKQFRISGVFTAPEKSEPASPPEPLPEAHVQPATLSPEELAAYLGIGRSFAYQLLREGAIPSFKLGSKRKVLREDADEYLRGLRDERQGPRLDGSGREQDG